MKKIILSLSILGVLSTSVFAYSFQGLEKMELINCVKSGIKYGMSQGMSYEKAIHTYGQIAYVKCKRQLEQNGFISKIPYGGSGGDFMTGGAVAPGTKGYCHFLAVGQSNMREFDNQEEKEQYINRLTQEYRQENNGICY